MNVLIIGDRQTEILSRQIIEEVLQQKINEVEFLFYISGNEVEMPNSTRNISVMVIKEENREKSLKAIRYVMESHEIDYFIDLAKVNEEIIIKDIKPEKHTFTFDLKFVKDMSENEMLEFGFDSLQKSRSNLIILKNETNSKWMIVYPEKTFTSFSENDNIAKIAVENMFKRGETNHPRSIQEKTFSNVSEKIYQEFHRVGKRLFEKGLLPEIEGGTYGNFSLKQNGVMYITGRGVHKGNLKKKDIHKIRQVEYIENFEQVFANVFYEGHKKPSIDTAINFALSEKATIHVHTDKVFANLPITGYNYPCGTKEELVEIQALLKENPITDIIQLYKHGLIVTGKTLTGALQEIENLIEEEVSLRRIREEEFQEEEFQEWEKHYNKNTESSAGSIDIHDPNFVYVVFKGETKVGFLNTKPAGNTLCFVFYSLKKFTKKGMGLGEKIIELVTEMAISNKYEKIGILTREECKVFSYYRKRGFEKIFEDSLGIIWMERKIENR